MVLSGVTNMLIMRDPHYYYYGGCVLSQLKPPEFYILSREKLFSQLRMQSSSSFILYLICLLEAGRKI